MAARTAPGIRGWVEKSDTRGFMRICAPGDVRGLLSARCGRDQHAGPDRGLKAHDGPYPDWLGKANGIFPLRRRLISALPFCRLSQTLADLNMSSHATQSTRMIEFLAWVEVNKKRLLVGVVAVAIVLGGVWIYQWHSNQAETEASAALLKVDRAGADPEGASDPNPQSLLQVATAYPGTGAGSRALLLAAEALYKENKYGEAKTQFENFLRNNADNPLAPIACLGVAACLDSMNKTNEAVAAYQDVLSRFGGSAVVGQAKMGLARLYEAANQPAQALKIYDELIRPSQQSSWGSEAALLRQKLLVRNPELVKTNAPPAGVPGLTATNPPVLTATNPPVLTATNAPATGAPKQN